MLNDILTGTPVDSIADAAAAMAAIDATLPDDDGVKWFNRLYLRVTERVQTVVDTSFQDPAFLATLDVVFANLYFAALSAAVTTVQNAPSAWRPLLADRHRRGVARIQFALAGMNAHINRDLPEAIVQSFVAMGGDPLAAPLREQDFARVNDLLEAVEQDAKVDFAVGIVGVIDDVGGDADDALAMWNVRAARHAAWTNAQVLWGLRPLPLLRDRFFARLDSLVGMSGRGLLLPRNPALLRESGRGLPSRRRGA